MDCALARTEKRVDRKTDCTLLEQRTTWADKTPDCALVTAKNHDDVDRKTECVLTEQYNNTAGRKHTPIGLCFGQSRGPR